ncbi:MAG: hypothetical protein ABJE66_38375 [Deltaproteobacteria bacterium]
MANERSKRPTLKAPPGGKAQGAAPFQSDETRHDGPNARRKSQAESDDDPTSIYDSGRYPTTPKSTLPKKGEPDFVREAATPIKVVSKKTPGAVSSGEIPLPADVSRPIPQVKLRAISELASKSHTPQLQLGYLAPPRDPNEVRARRRRDFVVWGSICVILACVFALGIWFIAKR